MQDSHRVLVLKMHHAISREGGLFQVLRDGVSNWRVIDSTRVPMCMLYGTETSKYTLPSLSLTSAMESGENRLRMAGAELHIHVQRRHFCMHFAVLPAGICVYFNFHPL